MNDFRSPGTTYLLIDGRCSFGGYGCYEDGPAAATAISNDGLTFWAEAMVDPFGNYLFQKILERIAPEERVTLVSSVQRCLDSRHSAARTHLVSRIVEKSLELMQDAYGNYVVQYVLDVCGNDEVHAICESVIGKVCILAIQKFSSNVMEKCLERCNDHVREEYLNEPAGGKGVSSARSANAFPTLSSRARPLKITTSTKSCQGDPLTTATKEEADVAGTSLGYAPPSGTFSQPSS